MSASVVAAPPSAAEVQRKLSVHAQSPPSHKRKTSLTKSPTLQSTLSGADSDSDVNAISPAILQTSVMTAEPSSSQPQSGAAVPAAPLSVIAERPGGSEDSDDDEDDEYNLATGRSQQELENLNDEAISKAGYLYKKGERRKTWKKRWFVLRQTKLSYYKSSKEYQLLCLLPLSDIHSVTPVVLKRHAHTFGIVTPSRTYYMEANSDAEVDSWVKELNEAKARLAGAAPAEGKKHVPPAINVQRSTPIAVQSNEPRTPPSTGISGSPASPLQAQHALTSSDSEDPDSYVPSSPVLATTPHQGFGQAQQGSVSSDPKKIIVQGYLMKCTSKRKNWRKRWFVLTQERLIYAKSHMEIGAGKPGKSVKVIPMEAIMDAIECTLSKHSAHGLGSTGMSTSLSAALPHGSGAPGPGHGHSSSMSQSASQPVPAGHSATLPASTSSDIHTAPQLPHTFKIVTPKRPLVLCAPSEEEEIRWMSAVRACIARRSGAPVEGGPLSVSPAKKSSAARREANASSSSNSAGPVPTEFMLPSAALAQGKRKEPASLTGAVMTVAS